MTLIGDTIRIMKASFEVGYYSCQKGIPLDVAFEDYVGKVLPKSIRDVCASIPRERKMKIPSDYTSFSEDARKAGIKGNIYAEQEKSWWKFW